MTRFPIAFFRSRRCQEEKCCPRRPIPAAFRGRSSRPRSFFEPESGSWAHCCFILVNTRRRSAAASASAAATDSIPAATATAAEAVAEASASDSETKRYITLECQSFLLQSSYSLCFNPFQLCPPLSSLALYRNRIESPSITAAVASYHRTIVSPYHRVGSPSVPWFRSVQLSHHRKLASQSQLPSPSAPKTNHRHTPPQRQRHPLHHRL